MPTNDPLDFASPPPTPPPSPAPITIKPPEGLKVDYFCPACGKNLRGAIVGEPCPICRRPVFLPKAPDELQYAHAPWLTTLARGSALLGPALLAILASMALYPLTLYRQIDLAPRIPTALALLGYLALAVGFFILTTREPAVILTEKQYSLRRLLRPVALAACSFETLACLATLVGARPLFWLILFFLAIPLAVVRTFLAGHFLHALARRIPNDSLADATTNATWALAILQALVLLITAIIYAISDAAQPCFLLPAGFLIIVGLWAAVLLFRYPLNFRAAVAAATRNLEEAARTLPKPRPPVTSSSASRKPSPPSDSRSTP